MAIQCKLSTILGERRIKMAELVRMTGVSKTTINAMYHDKVKKIDYGVLDRICTALECQVGDIIQFVPGDGADGGHRHADT